MCARVQLVDIHHCIAIRVVAEAKATILATGTRIGVLGFQYC